MSALYEYYHISADYYGSLYSLRKPLASNEMADLGAKGRSELLAWRIQNTIQSLTRALSELSSALKAVPQTNVVAIKNMGGLFALPNESLSHIFEYVVNGDPNLRNSSRWQAAVTLSHVCQHFRNTALSLSSYLEKHQPERPDGGCVLVPK